MGFQFDHLVHFVNSPEETREEVIRAGIHAVEGGRHENHGTYNALGYFGLSYIEWIGVFDQGLAESASAVPYSLRETFRHDGYKEGLSRVALRSKDLEQDAKRFRELGLDVHGPNPMSRKRPDGSVVSWKLLHVGDPEGGPELPFFIQWEEGDGERQRDLEERGVISAHPAGVLTLEAVGFAVKDLGAVSRWADILDLPITEEFEDESLQAKGKGLKLQGGNLVFYTPNGKGIVQNVLDERGEKPFQVLFEGNESRTQRIREGDYRFKVKEEAK